ncbi:MAG: ATP-binding protein [Desulfurococcaceae archaeon]
MRIKLTFVPGLEVEFVDREMSLKKMEEWARESTRHPQVVFGPEGCGKTAWLRQSAVLLKELGFHVIYVEPLRKYFEVYTDVKEVARRLADAAAGVLGNARAWLATLAIDLTKLLIERMKKKVAVLVDDVFQAIGLNEAALYVKALLGLIEYPPRSIDAIVAVVATSEGVTRREIGRHRWAHLTPMWNMPRDGFRQLYDKLPGEKPPFEKVWRAAGGNPNLLAELYKARWDADSVVKELLREKRIKAFVNSLSDAERELLRRALDDPDALFTREGIPLMDKLVDMNLIVDTLPERDPWFWAGEPPPEKDLGLGIGKDVAWQTPLHREAVRRALEGS